MGAHYSRENLAFYFGPSDWNFSCHQVHFDSSFLSPSDNHAHRQPSFLGCLSGTVLLALSGESAYLSAGSTSINYTLFWASRNPSFFLGLSIMSMSV